MSSSSTSLFGESFFGGDSDDDVDGTVTDDVGGVTLVSKVCCDVAALAFEVTSGALAPLEKV